ncbi:histone-binding protein N1/N2-like [Genypterus blacodes]|uniref:histone-binding protein N1/N2-like n=1 Tax=Genypterus blacodes TaxID=154954 RepID=UPI003F771038
MEEANKLIGAGKKYLVLGKAVEAVDVLQDACGLLAKKYGDTADECGEAFFWCGKALLDLARMENSVLGNALEGVPEEEEDEEKPKDPNIESTENIDEKTRDELREQVYDAMAEKKEKEAENGEEGQSDDPKKEDEEKAKNGKGEDKADDKDCNKEDGADEKKSDVDKSKSTEKGKKAEDEESADKDKESTDKPEEAEGDEEEGDDDAEMEEEEEGDAEGKDEGEGTSDKDEDEEVGNLQLAWEMLELAKVIYKRKETKDEQLMAAQAHLKLGEISTESGNYPQALEDLQECLKLQLKHLGSDSRLLAETQYQLGLTYSLDCQFSQAIDAFHSSIDNIKSRLEKLQKVIDKAEGPDALPSERKEMEELQALLPEIQEKVEDATAGLKTATADAEAVKEVLDGVASSAALSASTVQTGEKPAVKDSSTISIKSDSKAPVSDISHLVRKKRRPEESPVKQGVSKKVKQDTDNTTAVDEPQANGDEAPNSMEVER